MKRWVIAVLSLGCLASTSIDHAYAQSGRPSAVACDQYARNYSENASRQGQVLRGTGAGALVGLGIGSIAGAAGAGAAIGGAVGLIGGGARRHQTANKIYEAAYIDCMNAR